MSKVSAPRMSRWGIRSSRMTGTHSADFITVRANSAHRETGYMAAIPERYFQEKRLGLLGASIYGSSPQGKLFLCREAGVCTIYLFSPSRALCQ